jgi:hypothetical protein
MEKCWPNIEKQEQKNYVLPIIIHLVSSLWLMNNLNEESLQKRTENFPQYVNINIGKCIENKICTD